VKRLLLIGSVGAGKTTLMQRLHGLEQTYAKTESVYTQGGVWDTPGEFVDSMWLKHALQQASTEVELILFIQAANSGTAKIPPLFTSYFTKPVIGVVTKIDVASQSQIAHARQVLGLAGARELYEVSSLTGQGFDELLARLES